MEELRNIIQDESRQRNITVKGLSEVLKFNYNHYSQYIAYGYMTAATYDQFRELFPEWRDEEIETRYLPKKAIVRPKRITRREQAVDLAYRMLRDYDKTILPRYFEEKKGELKRELLQKGMEAEIYKRVFKNEDGIGKQFGGDKGEEVWFIRRINND